MKKIIAVCLVLVLVLSLIGGFLYVGISKNRIETQMWDYLKQENYRAYDIHSLEVKHSFMNIILSYNEWIIEVVYADELTSQYTYTIKNGEIVESGVSGTTNKEDLKHIKVVAECPNALVPSIMYNGEIYRTTGKQIPAEIDESAYAGKITSTVPLSEWPSEEGQANFGEVGTPYAVTSDGFVVLMNNEWTVFEVME